MTTKFLKKISTASSNRHYRVPGKYVILYALCFFIFIATGCQGRFPNRASLEEPKLEHQAYTLGAGDKIRITVFEHEKLSGTFMVSDIGRISLPLIRGIIVKGLTLPELEQVVTERLTNEFIAEPKVSIEIIELRSVCVLGEVRNPGCFSYAYGMTASKAIALSGGYTYRARRNEFVITKEDRRKVMGNHDTPISAGDIIEIFERYF